MRSTNLSKRCELFFSNQILFFLAYGIWLSFQLFDSTLFISLFPDRAITVVRLFCFVLLAINEIGNYGWKITKERVICILLVALSTAVFFVTDSFVLIDVILFVFCGRKIPIRHIAAETILVLCCATAIVVLSAQFGIIYPTQWGGERPRYGFGFKWATIPSHYFLNVATAYIYLRKKSFSIIDAIIILLVNCFLYATTDSRTSFILTTLVVLGAFILKLPVVAKLINGSVIFFLAGISFAILSVLSLALSTLYNKNIAFFSWLNNILSNRLEQTQYSLHEYGIHLFGSYVDWVGNFLDNSGAMVSENKIVNYVDNSYIYIMISQGWVVFFVLLFFLLIVAYKACRFNDRYLMLIMSVVALHSLIDMQLLHLQYTFVLFLIASYTETDVKYEFSWKGIFKRNV